MTSHATESNVQMTEAGLIGSDTPGSARRMSRRLSAAEVRALIDVLTSAEVAAAIADAIAALVDSSPGTLDTLNELAAALGDDANFASTVATALAGKVDLAGSQTIAGAKTFSSDIKVGTSTEFINIGSTTNSVIQACSNALGAHYVIIGDSTGSGGPMIFTIGSGGTLEWRSVTRADTGGSLDLAIGREAANVFGIYTNNSKAAKGDLSCRVITSTVPSFTSYGGYVACVNANGFPDVMLTQGLIAGYGGAVKICDGTTAGGTGFVRLKYNIGFPVLETSANNLNFSTSAGGLQFASSYITMSTGGTAYYTATAGVSSVANLIKGSFAGQTVAVVRGFTSQTGPLQEWQNSSSTFLIGINANGSIRIASGANARAGNATLVSGTVTVTNTTVTANTVIYLTTKTAGGTIGTLTYTLSAGASFTINSSSALDTSEISYLLIEVN